MDHLDISYFEDLYKKYYADLCTYALKYVKSNNLAEDIVSETFFKIWESKEKVKSISNIKGYLFKSVYNNCLYFLRTKESHPTIGDYDFSLLDTAAIPYKDALDTMMLNELAEYLEKAISKLPSQQQKVFRMKRFENKKNSEIAEELNLSVKTVEMHMTNASKHLKEDLKFILPSFIITFLLSGM
ncbi:RNA polymerase sigma-70 factor [Plebeiibacterium marinum]|uniref:RNA polymerase sigma-70 factor n=1 Tax=Plebeiibacterium marinum TaxID=2992111 RepID=A0AAE3MFU0_9BACT|nr:RNA polymerase sigma-70 factor [Plebeiobacterium marinum]MCW3806656.1 RNA polymerase sigma-70 factor [Plebeiobacterium marinum]